MHFLNEGYVFTLKKERKEKRIDKKPIKAQTPSQNVYSMQEATSNNLFSSTLNSAVK
jgi:hypothetical protein